MLNSIFSVKDCMLITFCLVLLSCQSKLDIAGQDHKLVVAKWNALAQYADSKISQYNVSISARLSLEENERGTVFKLRDIQLTPFVNEREIDLLAPGFEQKYVCNPQCFQLLEYVEFEQETGATLLFDFFDSHEFELFQFYADLVILGEQLEQLAQEDEFIFDAYLAFLANSNERFNTTKGFIEFLEKALSEGAVTTFLHSSNYDNFAFLKQYDVTPNEYWIEDEVTEPLFNSFQSIDMPWIEANESTQDDVIYMQFLEPEEIIYESFEPEYEWLKVTERDFEIVALGPSNFEQPSSSWQWAKGRPIIAGQNVCSYQENYFGLVLSHSHDTVTVNLLGQAVFVFDGVMGNLGEGALFSAGDEVAFVPKSGIESFSKSDVAMCILE